MRTTTCVVGLALVLARAADAQSTERVSVNSQGMQGNGNCFEVSISGDGRYVAFTSQAGNLVNGDTGFKLDIFVHDRQSGVTERVSVDSFGAQANDDSYIPSISADGNYVAFKSTATNLTPEGTLGFGHVFGHDRTTGITERLDLDPSGGSGNGEGQNPSVSADGRYVAFFSGASNLVPGDTNGAFDIFVRDRLTGVTERVSVDSSGGEGNNTSERPAISGDGRYVVFESAADNLVPGDTHSALFDIFVHDRLTGITERASIDSLGVQANDDSAFASISADGRYVAFMSWATNLVPGDTNQSTDVFVHDRQSGVTLCAGVTPDGRPGNGGSSFSALSADGSYVAFNSGASNLVPGQTCCTGNTFVRVLHSGITTRMSVATSGAAAIGNSYYVAISGNGRSVAFTNSAANLVPGDTNMDDDVFVRDWFERPVDEFCAGDGSGNPCPCGNTGLPGHGCENSAASGGARLVSNGIRRLSEDSFVLTSYRELPTTLSIFLQGNASVAGANFGDGVLCIGGTLLRLYTKTSAGGAAIAPSSGELSISARSAALGQPILAGSLRFYQTYYRDPDSSYCPTPIGDLWNASQALSASWSP